MILYMMVGVPGSGKSYYAKHNLIKDESCVYISRDEVRFSMVDNEEEYFSKEKQVFKEFVFRIKQGLQDANKSCVIADATHLSWPSRRKLLYALEETILRYDVKIVAVVIAPPLEVALERNAKREGRECVPEIVIKNMYNSMTDPNKDWFEYDQIIYIDNSRKE